MKSQHEWFCVLLTVKVEALIPSEAEVSLATVHCCHLLVDDVLTAINDPTLLNLHACLVINHTLLSIYFQDMAYRLLLHVEGANVSMKNLVQLCSWLRHWATSRQLVGSVPDDVNGSFRWHNPSGRTLSLGKTQPPTERSTRNISWGVKAAGPYSWQSYHLHVPILLKSGSLKLLYRDCFTFTFLY